MNRIGLLLMLCAALTFGNRAEAGPVPTDGTWQQFAFIDLGGTFLVGGCASGSTFDGFCPPAQSGVEDAEDGPWTFAVGPLGARFTIVGTGSGDEFLVVDSLFGVLGATPTPSNPDFSSFCSADPFDLFSPRDPFACLADTDNFSRLILDLLPGAYSLDFLVNAAPFGAGFGLFQVEATVVPTPSTISLLLCAFWALWVVRRRPSLM